MAALLLRPRWLAASVMVVVVAGVFVRLGFWQLDRLNERTILNAVIAERGDADPEQLATLLEVVGGDLDSLEYRRATVNGEYASQAEVLLRGQANDGLAGFDVVTPLITPEGTTVLVNRGWVSQLFDSPPVEAAAPPSGDVAVTGVVRLSQQRAGIGPTEPDGELTVIARIDLVRLSQQFDALAPVWLEITDQVAPQGPPEPSMGFDSSDRGPHLAYAIQWFSFAAIAAVGYVMILRRQLRRKGPASG